MINDGQRRARVTTAVIDGVGSGSGTVALTVSAGSTLTFAAAELETGSDRVAAVLGDGEGRWRAAGTFKRTDSRDEPAGDA